ncbi:MAG: hypothetical protein SGI74_12775 [Oligoflexia bacterium]|nr:hypothetical protein [Oligoflexia bacterium]
MNKTTSKIKSGTTHFANVVATLSLISLLIPLTGHAGQLLNNLQYDSCTKESSSYAGEICRLVVDERLFNDISENATAQPQMPHMEVTHKSLAQLELEIDLSIKDLGKFSITGKNIKNIDSELEPLFIRANNKAANTYEKTQRLEFISTYYSALQRSKDSLEAAIEVLLELSAKQRKSAIREGNLDAKIWLFEVQLAIALKNIMEPKQSFSEFVKLFMNTSTVSDPKGLEHFLKYYGDYRGAKPESARTQTND